MFYLQDFIELPSSAKITDEGFLELTANIARIGTQIYTGAVVGDNSPTVAIYRSPEQVADSAPTFEGKAVTVEHPIGKVNVKNTKDCFKGISKAVWYDSGTGWLKSTILLTHADAIDKFNDGYRYLSCGYDVTEIVPSQGEFIDSLGTIGEKDKSYSYQYEMRGIKGNHISLVKNPRAGAKATFDKDDVTIKGDDFIGISMTKKYEIRLADNAVLTLDGDNAAEINQAFVSLQDENKKLKLQVSDSTGELEQVKSQLAELKSVNDSLSGEIAGLKAMQDSIKPEDDKARAEWVAVYDSVRSFVTDSNPFGKSIKELKVIGIRANESTNGIDLSDKSDDYISALFEVAKSSLVIDSKPKSQDLLKNSQSNDVSGYEKAVKDWAESIENSWKLPSVGV